MLVGAGLPKIYAMLSEAKSYSERLFIYKEIGSLEDKQCAEAIRKPAEKLHVTYDDDAVKKIIDITKGYPFFVQQLCQIVFQSVNGDIVHLSDVKNSISEFFKILDTGFFKVRYERCTESDKKFIFVAAIMKREVKAISTSRAQLINKGIIYAVKYKELDFTVPEFTGFIKRLPEYQEWNQKR